MTGRLSRIAQPAVLSAPLRTAASTTTVPCDRAAISRLRLRNRTRVGEHPGGSSETTAAILTQVVAAAHGVPAGRPGRHRTPAPPPCGPRPGERTTVSRLVDPEGGAGDDGGASTAEVGGEVAGDLRAVGGRGPRAHHRHRPAGTPGPGRAAPPPTAPAARRLSRFSGSTPARSAELLGPLGVAGHDEPDPSVGRLVEDPTWLQPVQALGCLAAQPGQVRVGTQPVVELDRPHHVDQPRQPRVAGLADRVEGDPRQPLLLGDDAGVIDPGCGRRHEPTASEAAGSGSPSRSRRPGRPRRSRGGRAPRRSASVQATRCTRTAPRRVSRPAQSCRVEEPLARVGQRPAALELGTGDVGVDPPGGAGVAVALPDPRRLDPGPHLGGRLGPGERVAQLVGLHRRDVPDDVDPVRDRPADPVAVARGAVPRCTSTGSPGRRGGSRHRDTGCRRAPPSCGPGRSPPRPPGRSSPPRCSSGWRSASMMSVANSGNSSRKSTPCSARLISPGCTRPLPPPSTLALRRRVVGRPERRPDAGPAVCGRGRRRASARRSARGVSSTREVGQQAGQPLGERRLARRPSAR